MIEPSTGAAPVDPLETLLFATSVGVPPLGLEVEVTVFLGKKHAFDVCRILPINMSLVTC